MQTTLGDRPTQCFDIIFGEKRGENRKECMVLIKARLILIH